MRNLVILFLFSVNVLSILNCSAQTKQDTSSEVSVIEIFNGKNDLVHLGGEESAYKFSDYYISVKDMPEQKADSLKGKKILITGYLKISNGQTSNDSSAKSSGTNLKFITKPQFSIIYDSREPLTK